MDDEALRVLSRRGQLYLSLVEMQTIQAHFQKLGRDPTDAELETIAQTWSEHCSHKTLAGRIRYRDDSGERNFQNMLRETIFAATEKIRQDLGPDDWCVSVFRDNAGIIRFDDQYNVVFKVETHNHPSALEPYGGANTGIGGVIRDPMGTGMGAKPICNTDVFCFAPPDTPLEEIPAGVLHPRRVAKGVVSGVRDYGNRMGIPTVNGAVYFDPRYLGNPLVFCGNLGLIPRDKSFKETRPGDMVVAIGGRTGRDGIHGATFSSAELDSQSETVSGGAVQIGNAITEKMVLDVLLTARDRGLYTAVTDCGAGGFSSAVGEMGEKIGAEVWLDRVPLKYDGLSYTEIWISEAQERMVLSVPPEKVDALTALCASEGVEATVIGQFVPTGRLVLKYHGQEVANLAMEFLHDGRPPVVREAVWEQKKENAETCRDYHAFGQEMLSVAKTRLDELEARKGEEEDTASGTQHSVLSTQYSVSPPRVSTASPPRLHPRPPQHPRFVERLQQGMDHSPVRPRSAGRQRDQAAGGRGQRRSQRCGRAAARVDQPAGDRRRLRHESVLWRSRSLLDGGGGDRRGGAELRGRGRRSAADRHPRQFLLGQHRSARDTRFARACGPGLLRRGHRIGHALHQRQRQPEQRVPPQGAAEPIAIPPSLLISAIGQVDDVSRCVTMDLKEPGTCCTSLA